MKALRILCLTLCALVAVWIFWLMLRDPLRSLPQPDTNLQAKTQSLSSPKGRHVEHITLHSTSLGDIGIVVSLPDPLPQKKMPLLIVLGGLGTGENNIRYTGEAGPNAVIGYDWPMPVRFYSGMSFLTQLPEIYSHLMTVPGQVTSSIAWLSQQDWADTHHISVLGYSLGALAAPSIQRQAANNQIPVNWTILAYGGAPLGSLLAANPHIQPNWMRNILAPFIDLLLRPLEPTEHLPYLSGHFLVLEGKDDHLIPEEARLKLKDAVPDPKTVITFEGNHMGVGPDKMQLLQDIIGASKKWLIDNGAVNPI